MLFAPFLRYLGGIVQEAVNHLCMLQDVLTKNLHETCDIVTPGELDMLAIVMPAAASEICHRSQSAAGTVQMQGFNFSLVQKMMHRQRAGGVGSVFNFCLLIITFHAMPSPPSHNRGAAARTGWRTGNRCELP